MLDFPNSPSLGQKFPASPITGVPTYTWDGQKWTSQGVPIGGKVPVYTDGSNPMTAALTLSGDPVNPNDAADKHYVDNQVVGGTVHYDIAQSLTAPQQQQARQNIIAPPFDAMGYLGMQVNGAMEVSQVLGLSGVTVPNGGSIYVTDMWQLSANSASGVFGGVQQTAGPPGYNNSLILQCNPAPSSVGVADLAFFQQPIEGYRFARMNWGSAAAFPVTVGFWVFATRTGTACLALRNGAANRCYLAPFTVVSANTWEYKRITVPGDVTGTWNKDNTVGAFLDFTFMAGSNYQGTSNVWQAGGFIATSAITNFFQVTNDIVYITGVTCIPGNEGPDANHSPFCRRFMQDDIQLCKRYLQRFDEGSTDVLIGQCYSATHAFIPWFHSPSMRIGPTWGSVGSFQLRSSTASGISVGAMTFNSSFPSFSEIDATVASGLVAGNATALLLLAGAFLQADARF